MLQKSVYKYEYMDYWDIFNETSVPEKENFYSHLNMENITDADYTHAKRVLKDFEITNLGEYYHFYVQSEILLLPEMSNNFQKICLEIYGLGSPHFHSASGLAW